jgi:hypothetical protein
MPDETTTTSHLHHISQQEKQVEEADAKIRLFIDRPVAATGVWQFNW